MEAPTTVKRVGWVYVHTTSYIVPQQQFLEVSSIAEYLIWWLLLLVKLQFIMRLAEIDGNDIVWMTLYETPWSMRPNASFSWSRWLLLHPHLKLPGGVGTDGVFVIQGPGSVAHSSMSIQLSPSPVHLHPQPPIHTVQWVVIAVGAG
jgi:hypothetical protein